MASKQRSPKCSKRHGNALAYAGKGQRQVVLALINTVFAQDTAEAAREQWAAVSDQLRAKFPKLSAMLDDARDDVLASLAYAMAAARPIPESLPVINALRLSNLAEPLYVVSR